MFRCINLVCTFLMTSPYRRAPLRAGRTPRPGSALPAVQDCLVTWPLGRAGLQGARQRGCHANGSVQTARGGAAGQGASRLAGPGLPVGALRAAGGRGRRRAAPLAAERRPRAAPRYNILSGNTARIRYARTRAELAGELALFAALGAAGAALAAAGAARLAWLALAAGPRLALRFAAHPLAVAGEACDFLHLCYLYWRLASGYVRGPALPRSPARCVPSAGMRTAAERARSCLPMRCQAVTSLQHCAPRVWLCLVSVAKCLHTLLLGSLLDAWPRSGQVTFALLCCAVRSGRSGHGCRNCSDPQG